MMKQPFNKATTYKKKLSHGQFLITSKLARNPFGTHYTIFRKNSININNLLMHPKQFIRERNKTKTKPEMALKILIWVYNTWWKQLLGEELLLRKAAIPVKELKEDADAAVRPLRPLLSDSQRRCGFR